MKFHIEIQFFIPVYTDNGEMCVFPFKYNGKFINLFKLIIFIETYRKIPKVSPGLTFDIGANLVGLLSGGLTIGWAYFQEDFLCLIGRLTFQFQRIYIILKLQNCSILYIYF